MNLSPATQQPFGLLLATDTLFGARVLSSLDDVILPPPCSC